GETGDFHKTGFVRIVAPGEAERLNTNVQMQRQLGVNAQLLARSELQELDPEWVVDDVELAAYEPDSGYGDGAGVANDFLTHAREVDVEYLPRTRVTEILHGGGHVRGVKNDRGETIFAPVVIAAIGPWSRALPCRAGCDLPIETEFHRVAILKNAPGMRGSGSACIDSGTATYFRPDAEDKFLVGDFYGQRGVDPDEFPQRASDESLERLIERAARPGPGMVNAGIVGGVTGVYDMTPDARPMMGRASGLAGLYICAGFSGMGFKISPAVGLAMSELILDGRGMTVDVSAFSPDRFAADKPIKAQFEYQDDSAIQERDGGRWPPKKHNASRGEGAL